MASEPPVCEESTLNPGNTPFGDYEPVPNLSTPNDIPVYVPVGTAEKYRKAWGWDYFTNFIYCCPVKLKRAQKSSPRPCKTGLRVLYFKSKPP